MKTPIPTDPTDSRRPLRSRQSATAHAIATRLAARGIRPNFISLCSVGFACLGAGCLLGTRLNPTPMVSGILLLACALCIQGRLLCNLLDGLVAIENGRAGKAGEIYNDFPDRISDTLLLVAAGYATGGTYGAALGWVAAILALMTAYARVLGRSVGAAIHFSGPMAKQHRMATLTMALLLAAVMEVWQWHRAVLAVALALIAAGCIITIARRLYRIVHELEAR